MSFKVSNYFGRQFHIKDYNCWDLIREVWLDLTGEDIGIRTPCQLTAEELKASFKAQEREFIKLEKVENPCIVLLKKPNFVSHVGVYYKQKVLHINKQGVQYQPLEIFQLGFTRIGFYKWKK